MASGMSLVEVITKKEATQRLSQGEGVTTMATKNGTVARIGD